MKRLWFESYLALINNSVGTNMFRNFYVESDEGEEQDIMNDGEVSCAYHVSAILYLFDQQEKAHATVSSTLRDLIKHGWEEIDFTSETTLEAGDVVVWEAIEFEDEPGVLHPHIGFYIGDGQAVSNNYKLGHPTKHPADNPDRKISKILRGKEKFSELPQPEVEQKPEQS